MQSLKARIAKYIGVPFLERGTTPDGWDCWGSIHYIGVHEMGKNWPSYSEAYHQLANYDEDAIAAVTMRFIGDWKRIERPVEGCVVGFDKRGSIALRTGCEPHIHHVGLVLNSREMIHVGVNTIGGTVIEPFDGFVHGRFCAGFWERS